MPIADGAERCERRMQVQMFFCGGFTPVGMTPYSGEDFPRMLWGMKASTSNVLHPVSAASTGFDFPSTAAGSEEQTQSTIDRLFNIVLNMLHNRGDTEEIVQDTFIRAHRGLSTFRRESSLRTWLYRIAINLARNRYWYFQRRFRHATLSLDRPLEGGNDGGSREFRDLISSGMPDPAHQASQQEFSGLMTTCLSRLDPAHRTILTQRFLKNLSYGEIGAALGIRAGTVKSRLARARQRLRRQIADVCPEMSINEWSQPYREANAGTMLAAV
jgi:RNA polymerase sigma factor (sigma-70 family)